MITGETTILGNYYDKYRSKNPIERFLLQNYENTFKKIIAPLPVSTAYEVGTGEGHLLKWIGEIRSDIKLFGSDISPIFNLSLFPADRIRPTFLINKAEEIPFSAHPVDLVIACEVLEHLSSPSRCMQEFQRINARYYILSVPDDKLWKLLNVLRLKYIKHFGNTPGHINHWNRTSFHNFVSAFLNIECMLSVKPWIFVLATGKMRS